MSKNIKLALILKNRENREIDKPAKKNINYSIVDNVTYNIIESMTKFKNKEINNKKLNEDLSINLSLLLSKCDNKKNILNKKNKNGKYDIYNNYSIKNFGIYYPLNQTNKTIKDDDSNKNTTKKNTTKTRMRKKEEWKVIQFQHQINEKIKKNNLCFFMSLLFKQPRLEYALHHLAYEGKSKLEDFNEKVWIPHLIYRLFNDKTFEGNITQTKNKKKRK